MTDDPVEIFNTWLASQKEGIHTATPGRIVSYEGHSKRRAVVQPMIKMKTHTGLSIEIPPIPNVPVLFPSSGDFSMLWPLKKGDGCLIIFSEFGIGNYLNGLDEITESDDISRFSMTDAICIPGLWSFKTAPQTNAAADEFHLVYKGKTIAINDSAVNINGSSKAFVTHAELNSALQSFMTALNLHTHPTAASGPPSPPTAPMSLNISAAATTTVKTGG